MYYIYEMRTIVKHILFWIGLYIVYTYMMSFYDDYEARMIVNLVNLPLFMLAYYSLKHIQIPYLYNQGKVLAFVISIIVSSFIIGALCRINGILWMDNYFGRTEDIPFITMGSYLLKTVRYYTPAMAILAWESHQERRKELERIQSLEKEKIATELKFLKAQINPHFLFNTLNNLYSHVLTQSPQAPEMIMQLSGILDYVLYKSQQKLVRLEEEINTIEHFLALEKIRYGERLAVHFKSNGDTHLPISPLILLSIVENAFKHGASGDIESPQIDIAISTIKDTIICRVWNTKRSIQGEKNDAYKKGIGLSNIKRQLNLVYPHQHQLVIEDKNTSFSIALTINTIL